MLFPDPLFPISNTVFVGFSIDAGSQRFIRSLPAIVLFFMDIIRSRVPHFTMGAVMADSACRNRPHQCEAGTLTRSVRAPAAPVRCRDVRANIDNNVCDIGGVRDGHRVSRAGSTATHDRKVLAAKKRTPYM